MKEIEDKAFKTYFVIYIDATNQAKTMPAGVLIGFGLGPITGFPDIDMGQLGRLLKNVFDSSSTSMRTSHVNFLTAMRQLLNTNHVDIVGDPIYQVS